jgi:hypothetical protein
MVSGRLAERRLFLSFAGRRYCARLGKEIGCDQETHFAAIAPVFPLWLQDGSRLRLS